MYMPNGLMRLIWALCTHTQLYMPNIACLVAPSISILDLGSREPYQTSIKWKKNLNLLFVSMFKMQFLMSGNSPLMYSIDLICAWGQYMYVLICVYVCGEREALFWKKTTFSPMKHPVPWVREEEGWRGSLKLFRQTTWQYHCPCQVIWYWKLRWLLKTQTNSLGGRVM